MIKFNEIETPEYIWNNGFMFQWCCKCKALHVWHFNIVRGKTEEDDYIAISCAGYPKLAKLRKFYEKAMKKEVKKNDGLLRTDDSRKQKKSRNN